MTDMKKICPKSGESCDCPKGRCLQTNAYTSEMKLANEISHEPTAEQLCDDEGCPQFGTPHVCIRLDEQSRIDRQEAGSLKYALCAQILQLSSGKFALFGAYSMQDGIPLLAIDTWENLEPVVRAYRKTAEDGYQQEKLDEERRRGAREGKATAADYDALFGDQK